jgi:hypothetical protein
MSDDRACGGDDDDQLDRQAPVGSEDAGGDQRRLAGNRHPC